MKKVKSFINTLFPKPTHNSEFGVKLDSKTKNYGYTDYEKQEIGINTKKGDVVNTIIHENLHANHPKMPHSKVYSQAKKIESKMSLSEMAKTLIDTEARVLNTKRDVLNPRYTQSSKVVSVFIKGGERVKKKS